MPKPGLVDHTKFKRMVYLLGEPEPHCLGYLEFMWLVGYQKRNDYIGKALDVALACKYPGSHEKIVAALYQDGEGFIDKTEDDRYHIHDLFEHAPDYVKKAIARRTEPPSAERRTASANGVHRPAIEGNRREANRKKTPPNPPEGGEPQASLFFNGPSKTEPSTTTYPATIDTPAFRRLWSEWIDYRRDRRLSIRRATLDKQLIFLAPFGESQATEIINQSIRNGWNGLFAPKNNNGTNGDHYNGLREFALRGNPHEES